jgi:hypothetical protein
VDKVTAKSAPAVADSTATPVIATQNHNQRPDLIAAEFFFTVLETPVGWEFCAEIFCTDTTSSHLKNQQNKITKFLTRHYTYAYTRVNL